MAIWKVSYVIDGRLDAGGIVNLDHAPEPGEVLIIGRDQLEVLESLELIPPRGEFHYIHVTCVAVDSAEKMAHQ